MTEYRVVTGVCGCGQVHRSAFPEAVGARVQYGPGLSASVLTFYSVHAKRGAEALTGIGGDMSADRAFAAACNLT